MLDSMEVAKEVFTNSVKNDIASIMKENYRKVNRKESREDMHLDNAAIAKNASCANWWDLEQYVKDKKLGEVKKTHNNKKRWFVTGLAFTINKVDEKLRPCKLYTDDSCQVTLAFENIIQDVTIDNPLVIGYIPSQDRTFIKAIHVIKYKKDGSVDSSFPLDNNVKIHEVAPETTTIDTKSLIKIKTSDKKVVDLFDRNK